MTVKEVLGQAATLSGREDVVRGIAQGEQSSTDTGLAINAMLRLLRVVVAELSASFIPLVTEETLHVSERVKYKDLTKSVVEILKIYDADGYEIPFDVGYDHVKIARPCAKILYKYRPENYELEDLVGYSEKDISSAILAYGLAAEFALTEGDFDRACTMHDRYVEGVHAICKPKNRVVKERAWQ